jgi:hypothetical protein
MGEARHGGEEKAKKMLVGKPEKQRKLERPRQRWEDNIKMDIRERGFGVWIGII